MTCPTILLQPVILVTEDDEQGPTTTHWDAPVTSYAIVMLGGGDVLYQDERGGAAIRRDMRLEIAEHIVAAARLPTAQARALCEAALIPAGSGRHQLSLDDALAVHRAATRWAAEEYAGWATRMAGGSDHWDQAA